MGSNFKVGDRVMYVGYRSELYGKLGTIHYIGNNVCPSSHLVWFEEYTFVWVGPKHLNRLLSNKLIETARKRQRHGKNI